MTTEYLRRPRVAPHKTAWTAIATATVFHAVGFAALVTWSVNSKSPHVRFVGREQAFQLTLSFAEPQWNVDTVTLETREMDLPVVVEPNRARIGNHTYVPAPTVELAADDLLLDLNLERAQPLPEPATPTKKRHQAPVKNNLATTSSLAVAVPPSNLGNPEETPPDLSQNAPPAYPASAIRSGWEGTVLLRVWIDTAGHVTKVEVARSSGYRILDGAAVTAVRQWNAIPANRSGKPVATIESLPVHFKL